MLVADAARRLIGLRRVRVIKKVDFESANLSGGWAGFSGRITDSEMRWQRVRPWWAVWR